MDIFDLPQRHRTPKAIHPYVEQDLQDSIKIDLYPWVKAAFGIPRERIDKWTSEIGAQQWFYDDAIQRHLTDYCTAEEVIDRYEPFCGLANRVLDLARGNLVGIRAKKPYPVDSLQFIPTSQCMVSRIPEQGQLGADRYLDVTLTHGEAARRLKEANEIEWTDVLHYGELRFVNSLTSILAEEMKDRERASGQPNPVKKISEPKNVRRSTRRLNARIEHNAEASDPQEAVRTGCKRQRELEDPVAALNLGSSCALATHPQYSAYQGKQGALRSGSHALEVLSCTYGTRVCCHSTVLKDDRLSLWYYDACGIIYTNQILSLIHDFEKTAAIIIALASCTPERFGMLPTKIMKPPTPYRTSFPPCNLTGSVLSVNHPISGKPIKITLKDSLYSQYILTGRRTFVYTMNSSPTLATQSLMVKFAYQVNSRPPEYEFINIARKAGVEHLPDFHMRADLWKMSDGARGVFFAHDEHQVEYEDRTLRMTVYTEYGSIKKLFFERCDLIPVMVNQMLNCLHDLRYKANILHRDVSVDNIMFEKCGDKYWFILNDFDMATQLSEDGDTSYTPPYRHRTGTLPFMASSLLYDGYLQTNKKGWHSTRHLLCHDYESLFWVSLWCVLALFLDCLPEDERTGNLNLVKAFEDTDLANVWSRKQCVFEKLVRDTEIVLAPPTACLSKWLDGWTALLSDAYYGVSKHERDVESGIASTDFDLDTAGGVLSKDNILRVLAPLMPFTQDERVSSESPAVAPKCRSPQKAISARAKAIGDTEEPAVVQKRRPRAKTLSVEAAAVKAAVMSKLRPRKTS